MGHAPQILEIFRDYLQPGREAEFRAVEEDAARVCAELNCPHPHLAIESLTGPTEVWWLNAFESDEDWRRVVQAYADNRPLTQALKDISRRREGLVGTPIDLLAKHRPDLGRGSWVPAGARFFVVSIAAGSHDSEAAVFEAPDGTRFTFRGFARREDADAAASAPGAHARVFAVRPYWGSPAPEWIEADPGFWKENPAVSRRTQGRD
jgi:hypothetical protein